MSPAPRSRSKLHSFVLECIKKLSVTRRYVEEVYKVEMGNAQITQLSKAILTGADKGIFVLPKGGFEADHPFHRFKGSNQYCRSLWACQACSQGYFHRGEGGV